MLLKALEAVAGESLEERFSTLYRVDAIEGTGFMAVSHGSLEFQYPLSGRCY